MERSIEKAKSIDEKLKNVWMGHAHYTIIDNSGPDFQSKINKAFSCVCKFVGLPTLNKYMRKFLLEKCFKKLFLILIKIILRFNTSECKN